MSKLQDKVRQLLVGDFGTAQVEENVRPEWLRSDSGGRMELDFYIPEMSIAFEIQGEQHFQYVPFMHKSYTQFLRQRQRDQQKKRICKEKGIRLIEILSVHDIFRFLEGAPKNNAKGRNKSKI